MRQRKRLRNRQRKLLEIQIVETDLQVTEIIAIILIQIVDQIVITILVKVAILLVVVLLGHQVLHLIMIINMKFGLIMVMEKNIITKTEMEIFTIPMVDILEIWMDGPDNNEAIIVRLSLLLWKMRF